jgi:hypothetical protein
MDTVKSCEQVTLDYEKSKFQALSVQDRLQQKIHLSICSKCRRYMKDSKKMDMWLKRRFEQSEEVQFSTEEKEAIKNKLK